MKVSTSSGRRRRAIATISPRPTQTSAAATAITESAKICPSISPWSREKPTNERFAALSMISSERRTINGLRRSSTPPTPIANPGLASIRAAANPARGVDYLYYVRKPNSKAHYFTANETDFLRKVCEYGYACN